MRISFICLSALLVLLLWASTDSHADTRKPPNAHTLNIAFGSCAQQQNPQEFWPVISEKKPDLFIFMGDNLYIDSAVPKEIKNAYALLAANTHFKQFRKETPIMATWDDHDYGLGDGGKDFIGKYNSKKALIEFFNYPEINQLKQQDRGIYHSRELSFEGYKIQIIMLDTRWYRDDLQYSYLSREQSKQLNLGPYQPHLIKGKTLLGNKQWYWLEQELKKPADFRIIVSSIQVISEYTGWESWANFPFEREKLLNLVSNLTNNSLFLSGDIHKAEVSSLNYKGKNYFDVTSSGLDAKIYPASPNQHRYGEAIIKPNFGSISFKSTKQAGVKGSKLKITANIFDNSGNIQSAIDVPLHN